LLIEDDASIVAGLQLNLSLEGYEVLTAGDGETGFELAVREHPDLVVLDIMLPGMNGLEVLRRLRELDADIPVLVLTARGEEGDKVLGLQLGADDYISKPFNLAELRARINAALRRHRLRDAGQSVREFGDVRVDLDRHQATRAGKLVPMTAREFALLGYFLRNPERALTRDILLSEVWRTDYLTQRTIDNFVGRLRAKFEPDPDAPRYFLTVRGVGYRFEPSGRGE
ncbi:MAG: response regulator transcription factor, partial [Deltaproteobacteria bacterium]|nr:response regulator transcription factor [Deltaproteobacteria bacterium]